MTFCITLLCSDGIYTFLHYDIIIRVGTLTGKIKVGYTFHNALIIRNFILFHGERDGFSSLFPLHISFWPREIEIILLLRLLPNGEGKKVRSPINVHRPYG